MWVCVWVYHSFHQKKEGRFHTSVAALPHKHTNKQTNTHQQQQQQQQQRPPPPRPGSRGASSNMAGAGGNTPTEWGVRSHMALLQVLALLAATDAWGAVHPKVGEGGWFFFSAAPWCGVVWCVHG